MLNADKSDVMLIKTSAPLRAADHIWEIVVAGANLKPVTVIKSLAVLLDSRLTFAAHVTAVCKYHIWALRHIRDSPKRLWRTVDQLLGQGRLPVNTAVTTEDLSRYFD